MGLLGAVEVGDEGGPDEVGAGHARHVLGLPVAGRVQALQEVGRHTDHDGDGRLPWQYLTLLAQSISGRRVAKRVARRYAEGSRMASRRIRVFVA